MVNVCANQAHFTFFVFRMRIDDSTQELFILELLTQTSFRHVAIFYFFSTLFLFTCPFIFVRVDTWRGREE